MMLWNTDTGELVTTFGPLTEPDMDGFPSLVRSYDGSKVISTSYSRSVVWNVWTGERVRTLSSDKFSSASFSPNGERIISGHEDGTVRIWDIKMGVQLGSFKAHDKQVYAAALSDDGIYAASTSVVDGTVRIWNIKTSRLIEQLMTSETGDWILIDESGRFDSNNLDNMNGLNWIVSDDPLTPLAPEIFMRDYFEPRLLARLLMCQKKEADNGLPGACVNEFKRVQPLAMINRVQPEVQIISVVPEPNSSTEVAVTVEVRGVKRSFGEGGRVWESGVYDLHLSHAGQLVRQAPDISEPQPLDTLEDYEADRAAWRRTHHLVEGVGDKRKTFHHIRLPFGGEGGAVEFSAYAFNADRVKSATARYLYAIPQRLPAAERRAYIVAIGVSAYEDHSWNLKYADNDARRILEVLEPRLAATGRYKEVVPVPLLASWKAENDVPKLMVANAAKTNVKTVLDILAGRQVSEDARRAIPNGSRLQKSTPDDLVIIVYSSHGYADEAGNFYLFPYDIGNDAGNVVNEGLLRHVISSAELAVWMRDLDAGDLVMDSAASVEGGGFKPGPMGSKGLGQLAYDKGMRILASTRANDVAWESSVTQQGLLSYALVQNGLVEGKADYLPVDGVIGIAEWLKYAVWRVPQLYDEIKRGQRQSDAKLVTFDPTNLAARPIWCEPRVAHSKAICLRLSSRTGCYIDTKGLVGPRQLIRSAVLLRINRTR
jgi:hypothetical protein